MTPKNVDLRKHQLELMLELSRQFKSGHFRDILMHVKTGGGKTLSAFMAFDRLRKSNFVEKMLFVVPRATLQEQIALEAKRGFLLDDRHIRFDINEATNVIDPSRGFDGYVTTYQAIGHDYTGINAYELERTRYLLVLDEVHHVSERSTWERRLEPIIQQASYRLFLSGTLGRGDEKPIAFLPYISEEEIAHETVH